MRKFKKILVGVDLSWRDRFVSDEISPPNAEAVRQAMWLAKLNGASIQFFFALDLSAKAEAMIAESETDESTILDEANDHLAPLVSKAREEGIEAESRVVVGKSWVELIQQVLRAQFDLVIVGTRHVGAMRGILFGSSAIKLLRKCPCPVWVTQPSADRDVQTILVAHDLREVGDLAMELGCSMAKLQNAQLHVVHAAEYAQLDYMFPSKVSDEQKRAYREKAEKHIQAQLADARLAKPAQIHFATENPDLAILKCIEQNDVELVMMGTVGRTGIPGFITGNTAERLLHLIPCSLLAVKPPGFESPISL